MAVSMSAWTILNSENGVGDPQMKSYFSQGAMRPSSRKFGKNQRNHVQPASTSAEHVRQSRKDRLDQEIFDLHLFGFGACG
ncbi:MAG TPA: hypothetical protein DCS88_08155 [Alphaproteobacteria bacterium]|nr:hypothetical protein [Alphaproteobacteria bacterium]